LRTLNDGQTIEIPSRKYGRYIIRSRLGVGGMAEVFLADAVDAQGQQLNVAVKLMKKDVSDQAFADEADLMGLLQHPNLVERFEVGTAFGRPFIAMEFLIGGDLRDLLSSHLSDGKTLPRPIAMHVVLEVLKALAYFHNAKTRTGTPLGLVHGDVNPANVFFAGSGTVKLGDYGVAKSRQSNIGPKDGVAAGKLQYLSPEQTRGDVLTPASDLFAVGVMLHEVLLGQHPFRGQDPRAILNAIRSAKLSLPDTVDKPLTKILKRALAADVTDRYQTAGHFAGDLLRYILDRDMMMTPEQVKEWLEETLGLAF
jgi:eukaryotic-like serine/threonine-protein kinase